MKKVLYLIIIAAMLCTAGCVDDGPAMPDGPMPLVVEGWIEEGMAPIVMVTRAVDLTTDTASFDGFVEKWARVSIYDGEERYMLTGRINHDYMPPFIYTTSRLRGQLGHTYRLVVETETDTVEAETTMLPSPSISRIECNPVTGSDSLYSLVAYVDGVESGGYYKFFSRTIGLESRYYGTFLGTFSAEAYDNSKGWVITRGVHSGYDDESDFSHYFGEGAHVSVNLSAIDRRLYDFWNAYDSNVSLSQNLLFTFAGNCPTNIVGGLGYWAAYASNRRTVKIVRPDGRGGR